MTTRLCFLPCRGFTDPPQPYFFPSPVGCRKHYFVISQCGLLSYHQLRQQYHRCCSTTSNCWILLCRPRVCRIFERLLTIFSVSIQLIGFIPVGLATLVKHVSMPRWSVTTILTSYIFFTLVYGFFFVKFQKKALQKLESPKEGPNEENCFERAFNRIFTKIMGNTESNTPRSSIN